MHSARAFFLHSGTLLLAALSCIISGQGDHILAGSSHVHSTLLSESQYDDNEFPKLKALSQNESWGFLLYAWHRNSIWWVNSGEAKLLHGPDDPRFLLGHQGYPSLARDGKRIALVRKSLKSGMKGTISLLDLSSGAFVDVLDWPENLHSVAFSPNGLEVAFVGVRDKKLSLFSVEGTRKKLTQWTKEHTISLWDIPSWSPDGQAVAISTRNGPITRAMETEVLLIHRARVGNAEVLAKGHNPAWSPIDQRIAYHDPNFERVYLAAPRGGKRQTLLRPSLFREDWMYRGPLIWSPDAKHLIFHKPTGWDGQGNAVYIRNLATGKTREICLLANHEVSGLVGLLPGVRTEQAYRFLDRREFGRPF